jgi:urease accessory protein
MRARAVVVAEADSDGRCRLTELRRAPPIGLCPTPDALYLTSTAQGLVGDDHLELNIVVGAGATLVIRSVAATLAYASAGARLAVNATVAAGGRLDWRPEPVIVTRRCRSSIEASVAIEGGGALTWTEECLLGRFEEEPGDAEFSLSINYAGSPLLRHRLAVGPAAPGFDGPAVVGRNRAVGCRVLAGALAMPDCNVGPNWAVLDLDGPGVMVNALGSTLDDLRGRMAAACDEDRPARP